jgi:hypothetical protein
MGARLTPDLLRWPLLAHSLLWCELYRPDGRAHRVRHYKYCPMCLAGDVAPHFRTHWRFRSSIVCPTHSRRLEERCVHCGALVRVPHSMRDESTVGMQGALNECATCGRHLFSSDDLRLAVQQRRSSSKMVVTATGARSVLEWTLERYPNVGRLLEIGAISQSWVGQLWVPGTSGGDLSLVEIALRAFERLLRSKYIQLGDFGVRGEAPRAHPNGQ